MKGGRSNETSKLRCTHSAPTMAGGVGERGGGGGGWREKEVPAWPLKLTWYLKRLNVTTLLHWDIRMLFLPKQSFIMLAYVSFSIYNIRHEVHHFSQKLKLMEVKLLQ